MQAVIEQLEQEELPDGLREARQSSLPDQCESAGSSNLTDFERRYFLLLPSESVAISGANAIFLQALTCQRHLD